MYLGVAFLRNTEWCSISQQRGCQAKRVVHMPAMLSKLCTLFSLVILHATIHVHTMSVPGLCECHGEYGGHITGAVQLRLANTLMHGTN